MFHQLSEKISKSFKAITGQSKLSERNIQAALNDVRIALIESDVALEVVNTFVKDIQTQVIGTEIHHKLNPGEAFIKVVQDELTHLLGDTDFKLNLGTTSPTVILLAGLQGSGKTTTAAKLAQHLKTQHKKSVLLTSCDVYRPAAIEQLAILAKQGEIAYFPSTMKDSPTDIAQRAIQAANKALHDILIIDTAGRLHIDDDMMQEIKHIHQIANPHEILFVVDSLTGQDAVHTAKIFHAALPLTGIILTKTDGDQRGGAALSMKALTGKPIKFIGTSEKLNGLEIFYPERIASRILGMGDIVSLVEEIERKTDKIKTERVARKAQKGKFDLEDFRQQLLQMEKIGGMRHMMEKLPGFKQLPQGMAQEPNFAKNFIAIINAMTPKERRRPQLIAGSRKRRIAHGSGCNIQSVSRLLKQHEKMQKMMKKMMNPAGMKQMMRSLKNKIPPGFL